MIEREVGALLEAETEKPVRRLESRRDHPVQLEIGLQSRLVEIMLCLAQFFGVVTPIPGGDGEIAAFCRGEARQLIAILARPSARRLPDGGQKFTHSLG